MLSAKLRNILTDKLETYKSHKVSAELMTSSQNHL